MAILLVFSKVSTILGEFNFRYYANSIEWVLNL